MALLASSGRVRKDEELQNENSAPADDKKPGSEDALKICYKCKRPDHLSRGCQERQDDSLHANGLVVYEHTLRLDKSASEIDKVTIEEDDIHEIGEEERN